MQVFLKRKKDEPQANSPYRVQGDQGLQIDGELDDLSTPRQGERRALDEDIGLIPLSSKWHRAKGRPLRSLSASLLRLLAKLGFLRWLAGYRYVMVPSMINMIGTKPR